MIVGGQPFFNYIANGEPASASCWYLINASFVSGLPACGTFFPPYNAFQFNNTGRIVQWFDIPADMTAPFDLVFWFDFIDPRHDPHDYFAAVVKDITPQTQPVTLAQYAITGNDPAVGAACTRIVLHIAQNLAGHRIQINFLGQKTEVNDASTVIRVYDIGFFQG